jgi:hypothetical protein
MTALAKRFLLMLLGTVAALDIAADPIVTPIRWEVERSRPAKFNPPIKRGESVDLIPRYYDYGTAVDLSSAIDIGLYYRQAGDTNLYLLAGTTTTNTGELVFHWTPADELTNTIYTYEIMFSGLTNTSIRQEGTITMLPNLGYEAPATNPTPIRIIDCATVQWLNPGAAPTNIIKYITGPAGPAGSQGPAGPQGPAGVPTTNLTIMSVVITNINVGGGGGGVTINGTNATAIADGQNTTWVLSNGVWRVNSAGGVGGDMGPVWDADALGTNRLAYKIGGGVVGYWDTNGLHMYQGGLVLSTNMTLAVIDGTGVVIQAGTTNLLSQPGPQGPPGPIITNYIGYTISNINVSIVTNLITVSESVTNYTIITNEITAGGIATAGGMTNNSFSINGAPVGAGSNVVIPTSGGVTNHTGLSNLNGDTNNVHVSSAEQSRIPPPLSGAVTGATYVLSQSATNATWWRPVLYDGAGGLSTYWTHSTNFSYIGTVTQQWVVPLGVQECYIKAWGGGGGATINAGGAGGYTALFIPVQYGSTIDVAVASGGSCINALTNAALGGWIGGGNAGTNYGSLNYPGASGGGATVVWLDGTIVVVAAGGGGSSGNNVHPISSAGGASVGQSQYYAGMGGGQVSGGIASPRSANGNYSASVAGDGLSGGFLQGGDGGWIITNKANNAAGSGGGGGWYGGGGMSGGLGYYGAGGGSCYYKPDVGSGVMIRGNNNSDTDWPTGVGAGGPANYGTGGNGYVKLYWYYPNQ